MKTPSRLKHETSELSSNTRNINLARDNTVFRRLSWGRERAKKRMTKLSLMCLNERFKLAYPQTCVLDRASCASCSLLLFRLLSFCSGRFQRTEAITFSLRRTHLRGSVFQIPGKPVCTRKGLRRFHLISKLILRLNLPLPPTSRTRCRRL